MSARQTWRCKWSRWRKLLCLELPFHLPLHLQGPSLRLLALLALCLPVQVLPLLAAARWAAEALPLPLSFLLAPLALHLPVRVLALLTAVEAPSDMA